MARRKSVAPVNEFPEHWLVEPEVKIAGKALLTKGAEFKVAGVVGKCRFRHFVTNQSSGEQWIECFDRHGAYRAFDCARVKTVHRPKKRS